MTDEQQELINKLIKQLQNEVIAASGKARLSFVVKQGCKHLVDVVSTINEINIQKD
ncbi:MAG: hypothetical protein RR959_08280 [Erysipelotrichaceae bacterium]